MPYDERIHRRARGARRRWLLTAVLPVCVGLSACETSEPDDGFAAFRDALPRGPEPDTYVVEGDYLVTEDELREYYLYYEEGVPSDLPFLHPGYAREGFRGIVLATDIDQTHPVATKLELTYCIESGFNGSHQRIIDAMEIATNDWERHADVNYVYLPQHDGKCERSELDGDEVHFTVQRLNAKPGFYASAFFANQLAAQRILWITDTGLTMTDEDLTAAVRHELGHTLGLRHEHMFDCDDGATEFARVLTPQDYASIMWNPFICDTPAEDTWGNISRYDALSAWYLYHLPSGRQRLDVLGVPYNHGSDHNSDGRADLWWFQGLPSAVTPMYYGKADGSFQSVVLPIGLPALKDMRPFPGHFTDTLFLSQDVMYELPSGALDSLITTTSDKPEFGTVPGAGLSGRYVPLVGDFDDDTFVDIFWYGPGPDPDLLWRFDGTGFVVSSDVIVDGYYLPIVGDYDGDDRDDILWYDPVSGSSPWWRSNGGGSFDELWLLMADTGLDVTGAPYVPIKGDFDGDDFDDVFWYRPGADSDVLWIADGTPASRHYFLNVGGSYRPFVGDFDGDMISDIFWYAPGTDADPVWYFTEKEAVLETLEFSVDGDYSPYAADFTGDGATDIYWYAPEPGGDTTLWRASHGGFTDEGTVSSLSSAYPIGYSPRL